MPIQILSPEVASQIAAGEVVERPVSVVKELIENSLDAGATFISVKTEDAGQRLVEVTDDGVGIPYVEAGLAVERHATSKLSNSADLFHITTLGFRGEALASIGSVSRLTLTSRQAGTETGARLHVDAGLAGGIEAVGAPVGTQVRVENLFYNIPARLKFLKSDTTEKRLIDNLVARYALAYPRVRFHLTQDGRPSLQTSGSGDRREILAALYGVDLARQMLEVLAQDDWLSLAGFISPTSVTRSHRREIIFFVNGRPVQDATLAAALLKAYHTLLMVGRYPLATIFLDMPSEFVDVNVHPTKAEVRFQEPDRLFIALQGAVRRALLAHTPVPGLGDQIRWRASFDFQGDQQAESAFSQPAAASGRRPAGGDAWQTSVEDSQPPVTPALSEQPTRMDGQPALPQSRTPILRLIGQVALAYLVAEGPDGLYLVDQHAAHERVLFERLSARRQEPPLSQALLQPVQVELPPAAARLIDAQLPFLGQLGFQVEVFGPNVFLVRGVPALLAGSDPAAALRVLVEDFEEDETPLKAEQEARLIARVCKRAAIKAGQALTPQEQQVLLNDLESCQSPRTCPHGRPTMIHLSVDLLERQFGRRGPR